MSIGRNHKTDPETIRDVEGDFLRAHIEEYKSYKMAGLDERAGAVAAELRRLGHEVESGGAAPPVKETAVSPEPLERAVEENAAPKRRGRPARKAAE